VFIFYAANGAEAKGVGICGWQWDQFRNSAGKNRHHQGHESPLRFSRYEQRLISSRQRERSYVIMLGSHVHEVLHPLQDALRKIFG